MAIPTYANPEEKQQDKAPAIIVNRTFKTYEPITYKAKELELLEEKLLVEPPSSSSEQEAFNRLVGRESGQDPLAVNSSSLACGIPQALPCSKLLDYANIAHPPITSYTLAKQYIALVPTETQLEWMREYVKNRYGNANNALAFHTANGWY